MIRTQHVIRDPSAHTDDWLITYADMITLLLCFFVVFFVILSSHKTGQDAPLVPGRAVMNIQPIASPRTSPPGNQLESEVSIPKVALAPDINLAKEVAASIGKPIPLAPVTASRMRAAAIVQAVSNPMMDATLSTQSQNLSQQDPSIVAAQNSDRLDSIEINSSVLFLTGSAELSESGVSVLRDVAAELKSSQYAGYNIVVEGHTDDTPITTARFPSNWELSTGRAAAVVHYFLGQGLPAERVHAEGYADTRPKAPNRDANGNAIPENQALNRRVVIRMQRLERSK